MVNNTDIFGRKVFFISPDSSLIPLSFMEDLCTLGYESHIVGQSDGSITKNIDLITKHFPDALFFFNIDSAEPDMSWIAFIRQLRRQNEHILAGVTFTADNADRARKVESEYGSEVSPQAGCIALKKNDNDGNFKAIVAALEKTGAKGRRNNIRARCDKSSVIAFEHGSSSYKAQLEDVNISHLCCILNEEAIRGMKIYDKIRNARINVNGLEFKSDIVLIMKRKKADIMTAIFMFIRDPDDMPGLANGLEAPLNKKIYQITSKEFTDFLKK